MSPFDIPREGSSSKSSGQGGSQSHTGFDVVTSCLLHNFLDLGATWILYGVGPFTSKDAKQFNKKHPPPPEKRNTHPSHIDTSCTCASLHTSTHRLGCCYIQTEVQSFILSYHAVLGCAGCLRTNKYHSYHRLLLAAKECIS